MSTMMPHGARLRLALRPWHSMSHQNRARAGSMTDFTAAVPASAKPTGECRNDRSRDTDLEW